MRHDIQFLRGIAVATVVLYHAGIGAFANGYLGVDIFFVISGFLITSVIQKELANNTFSLTRFYARRARRLLPALYCTLIFTTTGAYFFLSSRQAADFIHQLVGALTFTANMVLPAQVGYFEEAAETKPLLHIWSLSLEEQYYIVLPLLLSLTPMRRRPLLLLGATVGSAMLCFWFVTFPSPLLPLLWRIAPATSAEWAFYLLPTRAWELLVGSLAAYVMVNKPEFRVPRTMKYASLAAMLTVTCYGVDEVHPRTDAAIVTLATAMILLGKDGWLVRIAPVRSLEQLGDISYSLYLVHWPLLAFAHLAYLGDVPLSARVSLIGASVGLAWLQFRFVENPLRYLKMAAPAQRVLTVAASSGAAVIAMGLPLVLPVGGQAAQALDFAEIRRANYGLSDRCEGRAPDDSSWEADCTTGTDPVTAIWGDSYAMHLVPGLARNATVPKPLAQITKSVCGPWLGLGPIRGGTYDEHWAEGCVAFNRAAFDYIVAQDSIELVFLGTTFVQYVAGNDFILDGHRVRQNSTVAVDAAAETIAMLREAGKLPVVVSPPPRTGFNVGECLERKAEGLVVLGRDSCAFPLADARAYDREVSSFIAALVKRTNVRVISLEDELCDGETCAPLAEGVYRYLDNGHLSVSGSEQVIGRIDFEPLLSSAARRSSIAPPRSGREWPPGLPAVQRGERASPASPAGLSRSD